MRYSIQRSNRRMSIHSCKMIKIKPRTFEKKIYTIMWGRNMDCVMKMEGKWESFIYIKKCSRIIFCFYIIYDKYITNKCIINKLLILLKQKVTSTYNKINILCNLYYLLSIQFSIICILSQVLVFFKIMYSIVKKMK